jgi:putative selenate reductase
VHQGKPYEDKPRLYLARSRFREAHSNAFYVDVDTIWRREAGREALLQMRDARLLFENGQVRIRLSPAFEIEDMTLRAPFEGVFSLVGAAEMAQVLEGINASLLYLPGIGHTGA